MSNMVESADAVASVTDAGFVHMELHSALLQALNELGYTQPTDIQAAVIPHMLAGRDVIGLAQTGTGKTAAFALPLLDRVDLQLRQTQVLVLAPTRELAGQVAEACHRYGRHLRGLSVAAVYGGAGYAEQLRALKRGAQIVIGTPGRIMDHIERGSLDVSQLRCLVLDEADEMLRMGFIDDVEWVLERIPERRQMALFSATMPPEIHRIASRYLHEPEEVRIRTRTATASTVRQRFWMTRGAAKADALVRLIEGEAGIDGVLVFVRTKSATVEVAEHLQASGLSATALNGDMAQAQRERVVAQLKDGTVDIVIATDVAARGLDVSRISHVINYDMPMDAETYVHRIGRTGRAGRSGEAILFVHPRERRAMQNLQRHTKQRLEELQLPDAKAINALRTARFAERVAAAMDHAGNADCEALVASLVAEHEMDPLRLAVALTRMVHGDRPVFVDDRQLAQSARSSRRQQERRRDLDGGESAHFRLQVGRRHGVKVGMIVGAIANEMGLQGHQINQIRIHDSHTTLSLPAGLNARDLGTLAGIRVAGRAFCAERMQAPPRERERERRGPRPGRRR